MPNNAIRITVQAWLIVSVLLLRAFMATSTRRQAVRLERKCAGKARRIYGSTPVTSAATETWVSMLLEIEASYGEMFSIVNHWSRRGLQAII